MIERQQGISDIWSNVPIVLGVIHLLPLPGAPRWGGSMDAVVERAARDARALAESSFDGIIVENFSDAPFFADTVPPETVASMATAVLAVAAQTTLPLGVNVLRNDAASAIGIAAATGARFVRVNVHTGSMWTDQGLIEGRAADTMRRRELLSPEVSVLADVHVKHAVPPAGAELGTSALDAWHRGLADALIVSGTGTGRPTPLADVQSVKEAVPDAAVLVGSGVSPENGRALLSGADGAIVGSAIMEGGRAGNAIDPTRASTLIATLRRPD